MRVWLAEGYLVFSDGPVVIQMMSTARTFSFVRSTNVDDDVRRTYAYERERTYNGCTTYVHDTCTGCAHRFAIYSIDCHCYVR